MPVTPDEVRALCLALPEVTERPAWGNPAFYVQAKKMFCVLREAGRKDAPEMPEHAVVAVGDLMEKELRLKALPLVYRTTPHYDGYAYVLVMLPHVERDELAELLAAAWRLAAPKRLAAKHPAVGGSSPTS